MVRANIKGVFSTYKYRRDGTRTTYWYHRRTGNRLPGLPGSPEFIAAFAAAENSMRAHAHDSFSSLIREYTSSDEFKRLLSDSTQKEYRRMLTKAEDRFKELPIAALEDSKVKADFLEWRDEVAASSGPREADNRLSVASSMITWAVEHARVSANHLRGVKRLYRSGRAEIIWLPEHIKAFMEAAPMQMQQALMLALHTGQRQGDLLRLPWSSYDGKRIEFRRGKSRATKPAPIIQIPCTEALRGMLDGMEKVSPLILSTKTGRSFKKRYFSQCWDEAMRKAGIETVQLPGFDEPVRIHFHDLRGTTVTLLSEAGCSVQQIATITGHSLKTVHQILEHYLARTQGLAEQAIANFENSPRTKFANQLQTGGRASKA